MEICCYGESLISPRLLSTRNLVPTLALLLLIFEGLYASAPKSVGGTLGQTAELPCTTEIGGSSIKVMWLDPKGTALSINGDILVDQRYKIRNPYTNDWYLQIENVQHSDAGNYTCVINTNPVIHYYVNLVVTVPPSIPHCKKIHDSYRKGDTVVLECKAHGNPEPNITWHRISSSGSREDLMFSSEIYTISNISPTDAGAYECFADNKIRPAANCTQHIDVLFSPELSLPYREIRQHLGSMTWLNCLVKSNPITDIYWEKDGLALTENSTKISVRNYAWEGAKYQRMVTITINELSDYDFGEYKCVAINEYGQSDGSILVNDLSTRQSSSDGVVAKLSSSTQLNCSGQDLGSDDILAWWFKSSSSDDKLKLFSYQHGVTTSFISDPNKYEVIDYTNLLIKNAELSDAGIYFCEKTNLQNLSFEFSIVGDMMCDSDANVSVDGDTVKMFCSLQYRGGQSGDWLMDWQRNDGRLDSPPSDAEDKLQRSLQIWSSYSNGNGTYHCMAVNRKLGFSERCSVELTVLSPSPAGICENKANLKSDNTAVFVVAGSLLITILVVAFIITVCGLATWYQKKLKDLKSGHSGSNGADVEMKPLNV